MVTTLFAAPPGLFDSIVRAADSIAPGAKFGLSVRSATTDSLLFSYQGDSLFTPASTLKLVVTATALSKLDADYQPATEVYLEGLRKDSVFEGVVRIKGYGDPNHSARFFPDELWTLRAIADSIRAKGFHTLRGILVADTSYHSGPRKPEGWKKNYFDSWYGAEIVPLSFNDNCVTVRILPGEKAGDPATVTIVPDVGYVRVKSEVKTVANTRKNRARVRYSLDPKNPEIHFTGQVKAGGGERSYTLPVRNPNQYFLAAFRTALAQTGIAFEADSNVYYGLPVAKVRVEGPPLQKIVATINQRSQNLHAELLLRELGASQAGVGSSKTGIEAERQFLRTLGLDSSFRLFDGSGLTPKNRVKPNGLTELLATMFRSPKQGAYLASMAVPGETGSGKRLAALSGSGVRYKTGFINEVFGLAGYIPVQGDTLAVATYLNGTGRLPEQTATDLVDSVFAWIYRKY
jgi:D-alanyl-D-alanine carboxypeptidase/D-alanyl-D-alanine-endopeptidase (penicillin-binding protein 4)